jgi:hypothetical protein
LRRFKVVYGGVAAAWLLAFVYGLAARRVYSIASVLDDLILMCVILAVQQLARGD